MKVDHYMRCMMATADLIDSGEIRPGPSADIVEFALTSINPVRPSHRVADTLLDYYQMPAFRKDPLQEFKEELLLLHQHYWRSPEDLAAALRLFVQKVRERFPREE